MKEELTADNEQVKEIAAYLAESYRDDSESSHFTSWAIEIVGKILAESQEKAEYERIIRVAEVQLRAAARHEAELHTQFNEAMAKMAANCNKHEAEAVAHREGETHLKYLGWISPADHKRQKDLAVAQARKEEREV